jgi:hypothetical protein
MNGLVIKSPWVELILSGRKTWEIRGRIATPPKKIGLIQSGSGQIQGICDLVDCIGPLSLEQMHHTHDQHRIPLSDLQKLPYEKTYAWVLANAKRFALPIAYRHPSGAVIWVGLSEENVPDYRRLMVEAGTRSDASCMPTRRDRQGTVTPTPATAVSGPTAQGCDTVEATSQVVTDEAQPQSLSTEIMDHCSVTITPGNINNRHIYIGELLKKKGFLPPDVFGCSQSSGRLGKQVRLDVVGLSQPVMTDVPMEADANRPRKFFRERQWVSRFFEHNGITAGDEVIFKKVGEYHYRVSLAKS